MKVMLICVVYLGAIQIVRDTFLAYFRPPFPHVTFGDTGTEPPIPRVSRII